MATASGPADGLVSTRATQWTNRIVAVLGLTTGLSSLLLAVQQFESLHLIWLMTVGGGAFAGSILLPAYAWSARGMKAPAVLVAASTLAGLASWPLAWDGPGGTIPWMWPLIATSTVLLAATVSLGLAIPYHLVASALLFWARVHPAGGGASWGTALFDTAVLGLQPLLLVVLFRIVQNQARRVDAEVAEAHREEADARVRESLVVQRNQLDAIVHDEVMTCLVAAARSTGDHDPHVTELADHAIASLQAQGAPDENAQPFVAAAVGALLRDVVRTVSPGAEVVEELAADAPLVPHEVARALAQAVREAALNVERHADAEHVTVRIGIAGADPGLAVSVRVVDDGVGFDPASVSRRRLGIRLSLVERMRAVGGDATVTSSPGEGTVVDLAWSGPGEARTRPEPVMEFRWLGSTLYQRLDLRPLGRLALATFVASALVALLPTLGSPASPWLWAALGVALVTAPLALARVTLMMGRLRTLLVALGSLAVTVLSILGLYPDAWPLNAAAFMVFVTQFVVLMRAGGRRTEAWLTALACAGALAAAELASPVPDPAQTGVILLPLASMVGVELLIAWVVRVESELQVAASHADAAACESATAFARLVARSVWLSDLKDSVGGLLQQLADPAHVITPEDRERCLAVEGRLRDAIKASTFSTPALSAAIMEARLRGVQVTLVDNRGEPLDETVRRATVRFLERVVRGMESGRVVARTAPEGYDEAVTIVAVDERGSALTTIDHHGQIATAQP